MCGKNQRDVILPMRGKTEVTFLEGEGDRSRVAVGRFTLCEGEMKCLAVLRGTGCPSLGKQRI